MHSNSGSGLSRALPSINILCGYLGGNLLSNLDRRIDAGTVMRAKSSSHLIM